jgi:hypothetical protein
VHLESLLNAHECWPLLLQAVPRLPHPADDENGLRVKQLIDSIRNPTAQAMVPQYTYVVKSSLLSLGSTSALVSASPFPCPPGSILLVRFLRYAHSPGMSTRAAICCRVRRAQAATAAAASTRR